MLVDAPNGLGFPICPFVGTQAASSERRRHQRACRGHEISAALQNSGFHATTLRQMRAWQASLYSCHRVNCHELPLFGFDQVCTVWRLPSFKFFLCVPTAASSDSFRSWPSPRAAATPKKTNPDHFLWIHCLRCLGQAFAFRLHSQVLQIACRCSTARQAAKVACLGSRQATKMKPGRVSICLPGFPLFAQALRWHQILLCFLSRF